MGERSPHIPGASGCQGGWAPFPCPLCGCCPGVGHSAAPAGPGGSLPSEIASAIALNKEFPKPRELLAEVCSPLAQAASQGWTGHPCQGDPLKTRTWGKHLTGQTPRWANTLLGKHLAGQTPQSSPAPGLEDARSTSTPFPRRPLKAFGKGGTGAWRGWAGAGLGMAHGHGKELRWQGTAGKSDRDVAERPWSAGTGWLLL